MHVNADEWITEAATVNAARALLFLRSASRW